MAYDPADPGTWPLKAVARSIVNQVLDESGASVERRQQINDRCDEFVIDLVTRQRRAGEYDGFQGLLKRIEVLIEGRKDYLLKPTGNHEVDRVNAYAQREVEVVERFVAMLLGQDEQAVRGWLPSWRWDEWERLNTPPE